MPGVFLSVYSPFVQGMANGTLPLESFKAYIAQDAFFLNAFEETYDRAAKQCNEIGEKESAQLLHELAKGVQEELRLHTAYAEKWGVDLSQPVCSSNSISWT